MPDVAAKFAVYGLVLGYALVTLLGLDVWK